MATPRPRMSKARQVDVFTRDLWLCRWCHRPVIFPPAMKFIEQLLRGRGHLGRLAYFHPNWRRDAAPLLDELGASVDHIQAHAIGGPTELENLATICARCNARKGTLPPEEHVKRYPVKKIRAKHGEPVHWDGLSALFVLLAHEHPGAMTKTERAWLAALVVATSNR